MSAQKSKDFVEILGTGVTGRFEGHEYEITMNRESGGMSVCRDGAKVAQRPIDRLRTQGFRGFHS